MTEADIKAALAKLNDESETLREELEQIAAAAVSTKQSVVFARTLLWLLQNAELKPESKRKPVVVKMDKVAGEW